ncbi:MAG: NADH-quinone oxidoreductase subunit N, partial [Actinobacteria bacterium]|nr:NADH-quinone oxidoreductase subunit N [Actinomycetota bacterium]
EEWLVIVAVVASVIALAFYLRVIVAMYMEDETADGPYVPITVRAVVTLAVLATIIWGIFPGSLLNLTSDAFPL